MGNIYELPYLITQKEELINMEKKYQTKSIYKITNNINHKIYIGQSIHPLQRFQEHCCRQESYTSLIGYAINKYGKENFSFNIIEEDIENYNEREQYWIQYYNSLAPNGYNIAKGGEVPPVSYGEDNILTSHTYQQVELVKYLLKYTNKTKEEIAKETEYNSISSIDRINIGKYWYDPDIEYPIRKDFLGKSSCKERWLKVVKYLQTTTLTQKEIAELCDIKRSTVTAINNGQNGKKYGLELNLTYPIRK